MTASEDQPQAVVLDLLLIIPAGGRRARIEPPGQFPERRIEAGATTDGIQGLEAADRDQPCPRIRRHPVPGPLLQRRGEGFVQRLLRELEAAEQSDEGCEDTA
jgi:hypothetical protein